MDHSMDTAPQMVAQDVTLELIGVDGSAPVQAQLRYDARDPYAVTTTFFTGHTRVSWIFGRDLLIHGLYEPMGGGDVHVQPGLDPQGAAVVLMQLTSPDGEALVQARACDLRRFVDRMTEAVPPGAEAQHLDIDGTVGALLAATPGDAG